MQSREIRHGNSETINTKWTQVAEAFYKRGAVADYGARVCTSAGSIDVR